MAEAPWEMSGGQRVPNFRIFLVGFPVSQTRPEKVPTVETIHDLVPEAEVVRHDIFRRDVIQNQQDTQSRGKQVGDSSGIRHPAPSMTAHVGPDLVEDLPNESTDQEDAASVASVAVGDFFSPTWIRNEAYHLLRRIRKHLRRNSAIVTPKLLLSGYGFGGIVILQAVVIANTNPIFYDIAIKISCLVLFDTPHKPTERQTWEGVLLNLMEKTAESYRGSLSGILSHLVDSVSTLSRVFLRYKSKYAVKSIPSGDEEDGTPGELSLGSDHAEYVMIRKLFGPASVFSGSRPVQPAKFDVYFRLLQTLSPSRWTVYECRAQERPDDLNILRTVYHNLLNRISFDEVCGKSIQIIAPEGWGKSAVVNLIVHDLREQAPIVVIENLPSPAIEQPVTLYGVLISTLHQILSQCPSCFHHIPDLEVDLLSQNVWTTNRVNLMLSSIINRSEGVQFLFVIHNFASPYWSDEARIWWLQMPEHLATTSSSSCTFITSSDRPIKEFQSQKRHILSLERQLKSLKKQFIDVKVAQLLESTYTMHSSPAAAFEENLRSIVVEKANSFQGSLNEISSFLVDLFERFPLSVPSAVLDSVSRKPVDARSFYRSQAALLSSSSYQEVRSWARNTLSWIQLGIRPLRMNELAVAAVCTAELNFSKQIDHMLMDPEGDIRKHMVGLVHVENGYARIASAHVREILNDFNDIQPCDDAELTASCLHYLRVILRNASREDEWDACKSYVISGPQDMVSERKDEWNKPVLELLGYVARHWPDHYRRVQTQNDGLRDDVLAFLQEHEISRKWFYLYLVGHGLPPDVFLDMRQPQHSRILDPGLSGGLRDTAVEYSAIEMASFLGLHAIVRLLDGNPEGKEYAKAHIRHGTLEHEITVLNPQSKFYLECVIANDDSEELGKLLEVSQETTAAFLPLHLAARAGSVKCTQRLLQSFPAQPENDSHGRTAIHMAAACGSCDVLRVLVGDERKAGPLAAMIDRIDSNSETALLLATRMGNTDAARFLARFSNGSCLTMPDQDGRTPIHHAVVNCPEIVETFLTAYPSGLRKTDNNGFTPLHTAARFGCVRAVHGILHAAKRSQCWIALVELKDKRDRWPLHWAVENGHIEVVEILLGPEYGAQDDHSVIRASELAAELAAGMGHLEILEGLINWNPDLEDHFPRLLSKAAENGQLTIVQYLMSIDDTVDVNGCEKLRPLALAASKGHSAVVRCLIDHKADIGLSDSDGRTPLILASMNGHDGVVNVLLQHGLAGDNEVTRLVYLNAPEASNRYTALHHAACSGHSGVIGLLLSEGADPNVRSDSLETPLHLVVSDGNATPNCEAAELLLAAGADVDAADIQRQTPLHLAIRREDIQMVRTLVDYKASLFMTDAEGKSPLYEAVTRKNITLLHELFRKPVSEGDVWEGTKTAIQACANDSKIMDVAIFLVKMALDKGMKCDSRGRTVLHVAARHGPSELIEALHKLDLDVNALDDKLRTPLFVAVYHGRSDIVDKLTRLHGAIDQPNRDGDSPLYIAASRDDLRTCEILLEAGAAVDARGSRGSTALYAASYSGHREIVQVLLDHGADPNIRPEGAWSPLHAASDNLAITQMLIGKGASLDYQKEDSWAPMHMSASWGYEDVVKLLLENGAEPNSETDTGYTPLHLAIERGNVGVVEVMVRHTGNNAVNFTNRVPAGLEPIHLAVQRNSEKMCRLLLECDLNPRAKTDDNRSCLDVAIAANADVSLMAILGAVDWHMDELVPIYWTAVERAGTCPQCLRNLTHKNPLLVDQLSPEGLNALEVYVQGERPQYEDESALLTFIDIGINPFRRLPGLTQSAFELAVISKRKANPEFLSRCFRDATNPRDMGLGFRELRIVTEFDEQEHWTALQDLRNDAEDETDDDGWNIDHFLYQSEPRVAFVKCRQIAVDKLTRTPTSLVCPALWRSRDQDMKARYSILEGGLEAAFDSDFDDDGDRSCVSLRADHPFPPRLKGTNAPYFEVKIEKLDASESQLPIVGIGLAGELTSLQRAFPGWNAWSLGYHGDDAGIFEEYPSARDLVAGKTYGYEQTIGCGIDYRSEEYLFTLDGEVVCRRSSKIIFRKLYPCIGHRAASAKVKVNFGTAEFLWKGANDLIPAPVPTPTPSSSIASSDATQMPPPPRPRRTFTGEFRNPSPGPGLKLGSGGSHSRSRSRSRERQSFRGHGR